MSRIARCKIFKHSSQSTHLAVQRSERWPRGWKARKREKERMCEAYLSITVRIGVLCVYQRLRVYGWSTSGTRIQGLFLDPPRGPADDYSSLNHNFRYVISYNSYEPVQINRSANCCSSICFQGQCLFVSVINCQQTSNNKQQSLNTKDSLINWNFQLIKFNVLIDNSYFHVRKGEREKLCKCICWSNNKANKI